VVLDNLESLLDGDGNLESVLWRDFLENLAKRGGRSKVLITTREEPNLSDLANLEIRCFDLHGLKDFEGMAFLRDQNLLGTDTELAEVSQRVGGIPLSLMFIRDLLLCECKDEPHVRFLPEDLFGIEGEHKGRWQHEIVTTEQLFQVCFNRLEPRLQSLLIAVSVFAKPFDCKMAAAIIANEEVTDRDLLLLKKLGFVLAESGCYRFQPQIQELVQRQAESLTKFHRKAISYYWKNRKPILDPRYDTLEDADPYLQIFHHYCELEEYESAFYTIYEISKSFLNLCGHYSKIIDLYSQLVNIWQSGNLRKWEYRASLIPLGNACISTGNYVKAISLYEKSLSIAQGINDKQSELNSLGNLGTAYLFIGEYNKSSIFYHKSLVVAQAIENKQDEATAFCNLGNAHYSLGEYQVAISFYQNYLAISRENFDKHGEALALGNLGNAYSVLGKYQEALDFYQKSLEISQTRGDRQGEANSCGNLGSVYCSQRHYQTAISYYNKSLKILQEIGDKRGVANSLGGLGSVYLSLKKYQEAINFYQQSLDIAETICLLLGKANAFNGLGNAFYHLGKYSNAIIFYQKQLEITQRIGDRKSEAAALSGLGNVYSSLGRFKKAIRLHYQSLEIVRTIGYKHGEAISLMNLANSYHQMLRFKKGFVHLLSANKIFKELQISLNPQKSYAEWLISVIRFTQRGKWQIVLCFCIGLFAFPLFLSYLVALLLLRLIKGKVKSRK